MARRKRKVRGNYRKPTPKVAKRYLAYWAKKGIKRAQDIPEGKSKEQTHIQRVRFQEAADVMRKWGLSKRGQKHSAQEDALDNYKKQLKKFKALKKKKAFKHAGLPAKYVAPKKPKVGKLPGPKSWRGGNFFRTNKTKARRYLSGVWNRGKHPLSELAGNVGVWNQFTPRVQEAMMLLGQEESLKLWNRAKANRVKRAEKEAKKQKEAEARKKKADTKKLAKLNAVIEKAQKAKADLKKSKKAVATVARMFRSKRRTRRARRTRRGRR